MMMTGMPHRKRMWIASILRMLSVVSS
uniref:Uncharacterized protein n=1 Tax=Anguilla anguilla TaxID=7936 RepID=A0A0E9VBM3_ANGAN